MLTVDQARQQLQAAARCLVDSETLPLGDCLGRLLAQDVCSPIDVPPFANSAMDGFAVRYADIRADIRAGVKQSLPVSQVLLAGMAAQPLQPGTAARVFTGSMLPQGADTVVIQEHCDYDARQVTLRQMPTAGQHIRKAGEDIRSGQQLLERGLCLQAAHIGLLASCGIAALPVYRRLRIGLLATGSELQPAGAPLSAGKIYNSNLPMLHALLQGFGMQVESCHAVDDLAQLEQAFARLAADNDVLISIGGVSVGDADLVRQVIDRHGKLALWKVAMKPGKPLAFGELFGRPMIGLPGNPVSAFVTVQLFVRQMLALMQGQRPGADEPDYYPLLLDQPLTPGREEFLRVQRVMRAGRFWLVPYAQQGSGVLSSVVYATGLARLPMGQQTCSGDNVQYIAFVQSMVD
jgi:molybdopterin molybdotransferase